MPEQPCMVVVPGSTRKALPNSRFIARSNPQEEIRVSIFVRRRRHLSAAAIVSTKVVDRHFPCESRAVTAEKCVFYGVDPADLEAVARWAESHRLMVIDTSIRMHRIMAEGTIATVQRAFQIQLNEYEHPKHGYFRGREGHLYVPPELAGVVIGVFGLEARRMGHSLLPQPVRTMRAAAERS